MKHIKLVVEHEGYGKFSLRDHDVFLLILHRAILLPGGCYEVVEVFFKKTHRGEMVVTRRERAPLSRRSSFQGCELFSCPASPYGR